MNQRVNATFGDGLSYVVNLKVFFAELPDRFAKFEMIKALGSWEFTEDYQKYFGSEMIS